MGQSSGTVLVVDDENLLRWSISRRLAAAGFSVIESETGLRVFDLPTTDVDLVLLDYRLPDTSGLEVLRRLRERGFTKSVIMMSAFTTSDVVEQAKRLGAKDVITKPFDIESLLSRVSAEIASELH